MTNLKYTISITHSADEDKAELIYTQTVSDMDIRSVIEAVNAAPIPQIEILPAPRKRRTRSDKGQTRKPAAPTE